MHPLPLAGEGWGEGASRSQELQRALGISYLFITHDIGVVEYIADDIVVMQKGRLEESGPAARVPGERSRPTRERCLRRCRGWQSSHWLDGEGPSIEVRVRCVAGEISMTDDIDNLILEHLRHIRGRVDQLAEDMTDIKHRMTSLETGMALVKREVVAGDDTDARQQVSLDRLVLRIERIEKRLELS